MISSMALIVAVRESSPVAISRSMFSSTTMASSTTMPMASTSPKSVRLFSDEAHRRHDRERADQGDRHVDHRQDHGLPVLQEDQHDDADQDDRIAQGLEDLVDRLADERRRVVDDLVIEPVGEAALELPHLGVDAVGGFERIGAGQLVDRDRHRRAAVQGAGLVVLPRAQLDAGHIAQPDDAGGLRHRAALAVRPALIGRASLERRAALSALALTS